MDWDTALSGVSQKVASTPRVGDWDAALTATESSGPLLKRVPKQDKAISDRYDPIVPTESYLWNELKKVPGGLLGLPPDIVEWVSRKAMGGPADFGNVTKKMQLLTGVDPFMRPPGPGAERGGIIAQNVAGSLPFAGAAIPARGLLGAGTELLSGFTGGLGQIMGREMAGTGHPATELAGNVIGSAAGYRAGNVVEQLVPIGKAAFKAMSSKEARIATELKARGIIEGSPEYKIALDKELAVAKGEILGDLSKAYAQEDMTAVSKLLDNYETITQKMPRFKASIGEITRNEPVLAMQAKLESRNIPALEERGARVRANEKAISDSRASLVPQVPGAGRAAIRSIQSSLDKELHALGEKEAILGAELTGVSDKLSAGATSVAEAGGAIKAASKEGYLLSKQQADIRYRVFRDSLGVDAPTDVRNVISKLNELESKFTFDKQPEVLGLIRKKSAVDVDMPKTTSAFEGESLLQAIRKKGGIDITDIRDLTGEGRAGRGIKGMPVGLFKKDGKTLDDLASELSDEGWNIARGEVDGGVQHLRDRIQAELAGEKQYSLRDTDRLAQWQYANRAKENFFDAGDLTNNQMTIKQLDDLAAVANRDIQREMSKSNPDRRAIAQLQTIREEAKGTIEVVLTERGNKDALTKYREANRYFSQEHAPKYLEGVNLKLRMKDALNEARVKPENVVAAYFRPNGTTEARRFNTQFADNGAAKETLARGVFDLYRKEVIEKGAGVITEKLHDGFMRKYASAIEEYPWIAKRLQKNAVGGEIAKRMEETRSMRAEIAASSLAKVTGTKNVDEFINNAISDKRFMLSALAKMKPEDRKNIAIAVLDKAWDESAKGSSAVNKMLANEDNINMLMRHAFGSKQGKEHLSNLRLLTRALEIHEAAPKTSPMTALSEDSLKGLTGTSWLQVMSAMRAVGRRPGSGDWFAIVFGGQFMKAKIDAKKIEILKEQLFDPQLLQATLKEARLSRGGSTDALGVMANARKEQFIKHFWDLSKAAVGVGAPTAALKRIPIAAVSAESE